ncbi:MAG: GDP-mannose-dependent alpha-(1-6)-phosphatidylinositol monomannoside mannosyltransferase [Betaproteobacteria bacterium ADurb.Bin341]|nr:MAG: GDP-mannose-dependent alpha-(1-6)-phosphatidylinositol monomannoside mannosyltransferase [Betaproteobacteria bacterium ADurb.Bin341]
MRVLLDITPITRAKVARTGLARVAYSLAHALHERSDLEVECIGWGSVAATFEVGRFLAEQSTLHAAPVQPSALLRAYDRAYRRQARPPRWLIRLGQALNRLRDPLRGLDPSRYDVVHSIYAGLPRAARAWDKPLVLTVHDITALRLPSKLVQPGQVAITRRIMASVRPQDWAVCISEFTRRDFLAYRGHPAARSHMIPNGVDTAIFHPCTDPVRKAETRVRYGVPNGRYVLTLSSLAPHKNLRFLLKAWAGVPAKDPDWHLVVAGGKTRDPAALAAALALPPELFSQVVLTGFVSDEDLPALMSDAQAFAFPSLYEGFGLPVLEAMACGCPVIASSGTSIPEVVGDAGTLLDPNNDLLWTTALGNAVANPPRLEPVNASLRQAASFSWREIARSYQEFFAQTVQDKVRQDRL